MAIVLSLAACGDVVVVVDVCTLGVDGALAVVGIGAEVDVEGVMFELAPLPTPLLLPVDWNEAFRLTAGEGRSLLQLLEQLFELLPASSLVDVV